MSAHISIVSSLYPHLSDRTLAGLVADLQKSGGRLGQSARIALDDAWPELVKRLGEHTAAWMVLTAKGIKEPTEANCAAYIATWEAAE